MSKNKTRSYIQNWWECFPVTHSSS